MISEINNSLNYFLPQITGNKASLSSNNFSDIHANQNLPTKEQMELLIQLEQVLKGADFNSLNSEQLLKMIGEISKNVEGGKGVFLDVKV